MRKPTCLGGLYRPPNRLLVTSNQTQETNLFLMAPMCVGGGGEGGANALTATIHTRLGKCEFSRLMRHKGKNESNKPDVYK